MANATKYGNYPRLPRKKREKNLFGSKRSNWSSPVHIWDIRHADWLAGNTVMNANYINDRARSTMGTDSKTYISVPDWQQKIAKGESASAAYSRTGHIHIKPARYTCNSSIRYAPNAYYTSTGRGSVHCGLTNAVTAWTTLESQAVGRLKHKLSGYVGNAQLAAPLAESREIHRLVRQINHLGMDALKAALAIRKTGGKSATKLFADVWLGYGFGIRPMLSDIKSAADSILKYTTRQDQCVVVRGGAKKEWVTSAVTGGGSACYGAQYRFHECAKHEQSVLITAGIDLQTRSSASYSVPDHLGLDITSVPSVLWELTPFSWVVDYFTTVGPWLDDMFYTLPGVTKYVTEAQKYRSVTSGNLEFYLNSADAFSRVTGSGSTSTVEYFTFYRQVLSSLPSQPLRIKTADEIASHGITKLLNLASVIAGRRGGPSLR